MYAPHESSESWPVKAYNNNAFLNSAPARKIRVLCELTEPEHRLQQLGVANTIVFFGSARIPDTKTAAERLAKAERDASANQDDAAMAGRLRVARAHQRAARYHDAAVELARELATWSEAIPNPAQRFCICSGGGPGIMEAANHGASQAGAPTMGLGISLPMEPTPNRFITDELNFEFHYFFVRKYWFLYLAKALVVFPGGFGTMDELFEMMTLIQTRKIQKQMPIVLFGSEFWNDILNFQAFVDWGVISPHDLELFRIIDTVDQARDLITSELSKRFLS